MKAAKGIAIGALTIIVALLIVCVVGLVFFPSQAASIVRPILPAIADSIDPSLALVREAGEGEKLEAHADADFSTKGEELTYQEAHKGYPKEYPLVAQCDGVDIRTPVAPADLTGVLFHQASYEYALVMTTELPAADIEAIGADNPARIKHDQIDGEWLDADAMHIWRTSDSTAMDTSIDIGAAAGTAFRSPVSGTVVLVKDYLLYEEVPDVEIHIQPDGHPDIDVVLIHTENPLVKAGDTVQAGVTDMAQVRDIATPLVDVQLGFYTAGDDPGNHVHIQVNDVNYADYREKRLKGAITL